MPQLVRVPQGSGQDAVYTYGGHEDLVLYSVSANVTTGANDSDFEVVCVEASGLEIAHSRTKALVYAGTSGLVTFAPYLPDTAGLPGATSGTTIQTGLAMTPLLYQSTVTVHPLQPDAVVTEARLWIFSEAELGGVPAFGPTYLLPSAA